MATNINNRMFEPEREAIEQRAYEIYVRRGMVPDRELEDWLEAEEELRQEAASAIATWDPYFGHVAELLALAEATWKAMAKEAAVEEGEKRGITLVLTAASDE